MKHLCRLSGSISLELALLLPLVMILITAFAQMMNFHRSEILLREACDRTADEAALLLSAAETIGYDFNSDLTERICSWLIPEETGRQILRNGLSTLALKPFWEVRVESWRRRLARAYQWRLPEEKRQVWFSWQPQGPAIEIRVSVKQKIFALSRQRLFTVYLPIWTRYEHAAETAVDPEKEEPEDDGVWQEHNLKRGRILAERFGANLPPFYPKIQAYRQGKIVRIKSYDLTTEGYQDPAYMRKRIRNDLDILVDFTAGEGIPKEAIHERELLVIIPRNREPWQRELLDQMITEARERDLNLRIEEYGESHRDQVVQPGKNGL